MSLKELLYNFVNSMENGLSFDRSIETTKRDLENLVYPILCDYFSCSDSDDYQYPVCVEILGQNCPARSIVEEILG